VSLVQTCMRINDVVCLDLVLKQMNRQNFYINQGTLKVLLGLEQDETRKVVLQNQVTDAHTEYIEDFMPVRGIIKQKYVFYDSRKVSMELVHEGVDANVPDSEK